MLETDHLKTERTLLDTVVCKDPQLKRQARVASDTSRYVHTFFVCSVSVFTLISVFSRVFMMYRKRSQCSVIRNAQLHQQSRFEVSFVDTKSA